LEQKLRDIVLQKDLRDVIEVTGRVDPEDLPQRYRRSDIFVSASMQEGMSNAMLEAMASGLPIVATRCEGVEELITDNGTVVEQPSAESLAGAIKKLADDRVLCRQMAENARKQAERFTWSGIAKEYLTLYERVT
jgi:glycosyltransferase involved in cell wall biosynthesis